MRCLSQVRHHCVKLWIVLVINDNPDFIVPNYLKIVTQQCVCIPTFVQWNENDKLLVNFHIVDDRCGRS